MDEKSLFKVGVRLIGLVVLIFGVCNLVQFLVQAASVSEYVPLAGIIPSLAQFFIGWFILRNTEMIIEWFWRN